MSLPIPEADGQPLPYTDRTPSLTNTNPLTRNTQPLYGGNITRPLTLTQPSHPADAPSFNRVTRPLQNLELEPSLVPVNALRPFPQFGQRLPEGIRETDLVATDSDFARLQKIVANNPDLFSPKVLDVLKACEDPQIRQEIDDLKAKFLDTIASNPRALSRFPINLSPATDLQTPDGQPNVATIARLELIAGLLDVETLQEIARRARFDLNVATYRIRQVIGTEMTELEALAGDLEFQEPDWTANVIAAYGGLEAQIARAKQKIPNTETPLGAVVDISSQFPNLPPGVRIEARAFLSPDHKYTAFGLDLRTQTFLPRPATAILDHRTPTG